MTRDESLVRSLIAGLTLGEVEKLGETYVAMQTDMFRIGHPNPVQSAYDRIVAKRIVPSLGAGLRGAIQRVFDADRNSPIRLLSSLAENDVLLPIAPPAFPSQILHPHPALKVDAPSQSGSLADSHLHSGGAIEINDLLELLLQGDYPLSRGREKGLPRRSRNRERDLTEYMAREWASDASGSWFSLPVVLGAVRAHLARLAYPHTWMSGKATCARLFADGTFWSSVGNLARSFGGNDELFAELCATFETGGARADIHAIIRNEIVRADQYNQRELSEFMGLLGGLNLLYGAVSSVSGEGLGRFVERFNRMGILRDMGSGADRARLVSASCRNVYVSSNVEAAEFRKTVDAHDKSIGSIEDSIRTSLKAHLEGASRFAAENRRTLRIAMPVGYLRESRRPLPDPDRWVARYSLASVSDLTVALMQVRDASESARRFISAVDVAGDESDMPSWPFLAAFEHLRGSGHESVRRALHVGESFDWPLQGVRRIGEVLLAGADIQSLGHCLALDGTMADAIAGEHGATPSILEAVLDLSWLVDQNLGGDSAASLLDRIALDCGLEARGIGADELVRGWRALHSLNGLREVGICSPDHHFELLDFRNDYDVMRSEPWARAAWSLAFRSPGDDLLRGDLDARTTAEFHILQQSIIGEARERALDLIREKNIVVEACPTSNLRLANIPSGRMSHIKRFVVDKQLRVSLNSDDPIVFGTNIEAEWAAIAGWFDLDLAVAMATTSLEACSAHPDELDSAALLRWGTLVG